MIYPKKIENWINGCDCASQSGDYFDKINPANGKMIAHVAKSGRADVEQAVNQAAESLALWSQTPIIKRAEIIRQSAILLSQRIEEMSEIISEETGKSLKDAKAETQGVVEMGYFVAGEGRRYYGKTTSSAVDGRWAMTIRQPVGVCGLIVAANTPLANVAWKCYPALLCGNTAILKPSENTPYTAVWFAKLLLEAGLTPGILSVINGLGNEAGSYLVENNKVNLISFTGSVAVGKQINKIVGERLAKVCLELGGKNPLVICDDADLERAVNDALLSAFSNAGQRCASASRIIVFDGVYEKFKNQFIEKINKLKIGTDDDCALGPVISESQLQIMLASIETAEKAGTKILTGGKRLLDPEHQNGFFLAPTVLENAALDADISQKEIFGPITCLYRVNDLREAIAVANNTNFGLTSAIHTDNIHRIETFKNAIQAGIVSVNGPTYGSEPHLPFGGLKDSGNGFREAGQEALDVYSEWKTIYCKSDEKRI